MTEKRVGFLCNIAFNLPSKNDTHKVLKSYYLMRCREVTKGYGLPPKYFSSTKRCSYCYSDWTRDSDVKVQPLKPSKSSHQRMKSKKQSCLQQNEMVQVCTFCGKSTKTTLVKPERLYKTPTPKEHFERKANNHKQDPKKTPNTQKANKKVTSLKPEKNNVVNLYANAFDVFSLKNEKNTISSAIKVPAKVIKNNKKRKDKFAGLCQKAVLASVKLKEEKTKQTPQPMQNKLNLFLKPSTD